MIPASVAAEETKVTVGPFEITTNEGSAANSYIYSDGVLTVNDGADITISMTSGATEPTSDRIVVNGNAKITLNGVNITPADAGTSDGYSGIDLTSGATLNITLQSGSSNVINGGTSITGLPGPGIHVPEDSTLTIEGNGSLEVHGASREGSAAAGIGGKISVDGAGEACGNVIILGGTITVQGGTPTVAGSTATDIGGGQGSPDGGNGQGIRPVSGKENTYTVWGNLTLPCDITIPQGATVVIPEGASLTVPQNVKLTNNGTIHKDGGSFINDGTVVGNGEYPADDRYTINYEEETITIASGYEVYTAETGGNKIESNSSITAYIGKYLYIQQTGSETTGRTEIKIPARPAAPTVTATIDYDEEKLNGVTLSNLEYALSQSNPNWQAVPSSAALSDMGWTGNQIYLYFRLKATDTSFASDATYGVQIPSRPAAPTRASAAGTGPDSPCPSGAASFRSFEKCRAARRGTGRLWIPDTAARGHSRGWPGRPDARPRPRRTFQRNRSASCRPRCPRAGRCTPVRRYRGARPDTRSPGRRARPGRRFA